MINDFNRWLNENDDSELWAYPLIVQTEVSLYEGLHKGDIVFFVKQRLFENKIPELIIFKDSPSSKAQIRLNQVLPSDVVEEISNLNWSVYDSSRSSDYTFEIIAKHVEEVEKSSTYKNWKTKNTSKRL